MDKLVALGPKNVVGVLRMIPFPTATSSSSPSNFKSGNQPKRVEIDLVTQRGACWYKVKAMKAATVHSILVGSAAMGHKSVLASAKELLTGAEANLVNYAVPIVVFSFSQGVTDEVKMRLLDLGVRVEGAVVDPDDGDEQYDDDDEDKEDGNYSSEEDAEDLIREPPPLKRAPIVYEPVSTADAFVELTTVNLDVTTLICLVSDVTNGGSVHDFADEILRDQALAERREPSLPILLKFMEGKRLICTKTAFAHFINIAKIVGGPREIARAEEWRSKLEIVDDDPSEAARKLTGPKIKEQHKIVFGTGDRYKAVTTTSNSALMRAAEQQGLKFCVFLHPARALTEQKSPA